MKPTKPTSSRKNIKCYAFLAFISACVYIYYFYLYVPNDSLPLRVSFYPSSNATKLYPMGIKAGTDKIINHGYEILYAKYFEINPNLRGKKLKIMEIGLGCTMGYGPGKSAEMWRSYFPNAQLWFAEFDANCVQKHKSILDSLGVRVVTGDQKDLKTLSEWVKITKGDFDIIIDDGGHSNMQMYNSIIHLFSKALSPGGVYFIEDLTASRISQYVDGDKQHMMIDIIKDWIESITLDTYAQKPRYPLLADLKFIDCTYRICAFLKCNFDDKYCKH